MVEEELLLGYGPGQNQDDVLSMGIFQEEMKQAAKFQEMFEEIN